jgi:hypothetical protein
MIAIPRVELDQEYVVVISYCNSEHAAAPAGSGDLPIALRLNLEGTVGPP